MELEQVEQRIRPAISSLRKTIYYLFILLSLSWSENFLLLNVMLLEAMTYRRTCRS